MDVKKLWYVAKPFVVYLIAKTAAMLLINLLLATIPAPALIAWISENKNPANAVVNAIASVAAVMCLLNDFVIEVGTSGEINIDNSLLRQSLSCLRSDCKACRGMSKSLVAAVVLAADSSIALNTIIGFFSVSSERYDSVEAIQYSVPVWLGLILYGIVSPLVEETVFRGILYHRMRRYYRVLVCVITTSVLFGGFHGNLPQFLYGTLMGVLMALCYEWTGRFLVPLLFHMTANILVFLLSGIPAEYYSFLQNIPALIALCGLSAALIWYMRHKKI